MISITHHATLNEMNVREIRKDVAELLNKDDGHGFDHVLRVGRLALRFAEKEGANTEVVELATLLHDVDDYKLFGEDSAHSLPNATTLLEKYNTLPEVKEQVLGIIATMGYNKYLDGIRPGTLEGRVVSDADMCDAIGAEGILRTHAYALSKGNMFFNPDLPPERAIKNAASYRAGSSGHSVQHFFDKLLIIPSIMMTAAGQEEAQKREKIMVDFLEELFREQSADEWQEKLLSHRMRAR